jgi:hypothetical protein
VVKVVCVPLLRVWDRVLSGDDTARTEPRTVHALDCFHVGRCDEGRSVDSAVRSTPSEVEAFRSDTQLGQVAAQLPGTLVLL